MLNVTKKKDFQEFFLTFKKKAFGILFWNLNGLSGARNELDDSF